MNTTASQNHGRSATPNGNKAYDEERQEWGSVPAWSTWPKKLRAPRLRRTAIYLLLIDVIITAVVVRCFEPLITLLRRNEEMFGPRLTLPLDSPNNTEQQSAEPVIPRIFHQTIKTDLIPDEWIHSQKSCKDAYSEFEYKLWTDELAREFIEAEYPWFVETWDNYRFNIQRADVIRYFVLNHYGGIYLDMDTLCNHTIPFEQIEAAGGEHFAVFKSTTPTGVSNDFMISSAHHPIFEAAITNLFFYNDITRFWANLLPHAAIMIASGPFFISMIIKNYLLALPSLPTPTFQVINATELTPYITDLEGCSWHHGDTKTLMWVGDRPWVWFSLGGIGLAIGLHIINHFLMVAWRRFDKTAPVDDTLKVAKLT